MTKQHNLIPEKVYLSTSSAPAPSARGVKDGDIKTSNTRFLPSTFLLPMAFGKRADRVRDDTAFFFTERARSYPRERGASRIHLCTGFAPLPQVSQRKHRCRTPSKDGQYRLFRRCKATSLTIPYHTTQWTSFGASIVLYDFF